MAGILVGEIAPIVPRKSAKYRRKVIGKSRVSCYSPAVVGLFSKLTLLFTALLSSAFLGEVPHLYHVLAFTLIMGGFVVYSRR
jgi:hypothetical protein